MQAGESTHCVLTLHAGENPCFYNVDLICEVRLSGYLRSKFPLIPKARGFGLLTFNIGNFGTKQKGYSYKEYETALKSVTDQFIKIN